MWSGKRVLPGTMRGPSAAAAAASAAAAAASAAAAPAAAAGSPGCRRKARARRAAADVAAAAAAAAESAPQPGMSSMLVAVKGQSAGPRLCCEHCRPRLCDWGRVSDCA